MPAFGERSPKLAKKADDQFPITSSLDPKFVCRPEVLKTAGYAPNGHRCDSGLPARQGPIGKFVRMRAAGRGGTVPESIQGGLG